MYAENTIFQGSHYGDGIKNINLLEKNLKSRYNTYVS